MPLYEYYCEDCQKDFILLQSTSVDKSATTCSECGGANTQHRMSACVSKIPGSPKKLSSPVTADELPKKSVLNLPLPRLRSEL